MRPSITILKKCVRALQANVLYHLEAHAVINKTFDLMHSSSTFRRKAALNYPEFAVVFRGSLTVVISARIIFPSANPYASLSVTRYCELTFLSP